MINKDFFQALEDLETEKKINKETFISTLETALTSAYKKMYGEAKSAMVKLNPEKATIKIYSYKTVVDEVQDPDKEISLSEAHLIKKSYKVGDIVAYIADDGNIVTHRIIEKNENGFYTKGDNNNTKDETLIHSNSIIGKFKTILYSSKTRENTSQ